MRNTKVWVLNRLLRHLFCAITPNEGLRLASLDQKTRAGTLKRNEKEVPRPEALELASEARFVLKAKVFAEVLERMKHEAYKTMFEKSKNVDDMVFGKAMLYNVEVLRQKFEQIAKIER